MDQERNRPRQEDFDRALLLLVAEPQSGFEEVFRELVSREVERMFRPDPETGERAG